MKLISLALAVAIGLGFASVSVATDHYVRGYTRANGTYVAPHQQSNPNSTRNDNYSTRGNVNPYTGVSGTKPRDEDQDDTDATDSDPASRPPNSGSSR